MALRLSNPARNPSTLSLASASRWAATLGLVLVAACGSGDKTQSASGPAAPSGAAKAASTGGAATAVLATCTKKALGKCVETMGSLPMLAEELCKAGGDDTAVFAKGGACSHDNLLGTCTVASTDSTDVQYFYKQAGNDAEITKSLCVELLMGKWSPAPGGAAAGDAPKADAKASDPAKPNDAAKSDAPKGGAKGKKKK